MALKNVLVAYNNSQSAQSALDAALVMQARFDTHLTGLVAHELPRPGYLMDGWVPEAVRQTIVESELATCAAIEAAWNRAVDGRCLENKTHWIQTTGEADATVMTYARYFDLTVMGQAGKSEAEMPLVSHPDLIAMQSGRPVMVVPTEFDRQPVNNRVVLAWDGRRAAARAMADALQFLEEMSLVTILTVGDPELVEHDLQIDVETHLARHGIKTERKNLATRRGGNVAVGEAITEYCDQTRPDVLVMGAYEHSKFREDTFGGVTNTVFEHMTIPVFMSH